MAGRSNLNLTQSIQPSAQVRAQAAAGASIPVTRVSNVPAAAPFNANGQHHGQRSQRGASTQDNQLNAHPSQPHQPQHIPQAARSTEVRYALQAYMERSITQRRADAVQEPMRCSRRPNGIRNAQSTPQVTPPRNIGPAYNLHFGLQTPHGSPRDQMPHRAAAAQAPHGYPTTLHIPYEYPGAQIQPVTYPSHRSDSVRQNLQLLEIQTHERLAHNHQVKAASYAIQTEYYTEQVQSTRMHLQKLIEYQFPISIGSRILKQEKQELAERKLILKEKICEYMTQLKVHENRLKYHQTQENYYQEKAVALRRQYNELMPASQRTDTQANKGAIITQQRMSISAPDTGMLDPSIIIPSATRPKMPAPNISAHPSARLAPAEPAMFRFPQGAAFDSTMPEIRRVTRPHLGNETNQFIARQHDLVIARQALIVARERLAQINQPESSTSSASLQQRRLQETQLPKSKPRYEPKK